MRIRREYYPALAAGLLLFSCAGVDANSTDPGQRVESGTTGTDVVFSDPAAWRILCPASGLELELAAASTYRPPFRSPTSIALLPDVYADFDLELEMLPTGPEYAHRDLCVFFAFESPSRFGYVHLASVPDPNAHNVFVVEGAPRRNVLPPQPRGVVWGDGVWHRVRVTRHGDALDVYFDDPQTPILSARIPPIAGRIGVGSFDDLGRFRAITVRGAPVRADVSDPFGGDLSFPRADRERGDDGK